MEEKNERIDRLRSCAVDFYWCDKLGTDWNLWVQFGFLVVWYRNDGKQYYLCNRRYCRSCMVDIDVH